VVSTSPTPPVTPTRTRRELIDHYLRVIGAVSRVLEPLDPDQQDSYIRAAMRAHIDEERERRGFLRCGPQSVARAHQAAIGHSDFAITFAIACADLTLNPLGRWPILDGGA
jgi:hypothetical protein